VKNPLNATWLIVSRSAIVLAFSITAFLVGWNQGHDTGYISAMADVVLKQVDAEDFMTRYLVSIGRLDPARFPRKDSK
jgi:hypothetical protein